MHFSFPTAVVLLAASLAPVVHADFDIYMVLGETNTGIPYEGYQVFDGAPANCDAVRSAKYWDAWFDVSGRKLGVRCRGGHRGIGCIDEYDPVHEIRALEMHFANDPLLHWTIYPNHGYYMWGLDNKSYGQCTPFPGPDGDFDCGKLHGGRGRRKFRCISEFTAEQIQNAAPASYKNPGHDVWDPLHG